MKILFLGSVFASENEEEVIQNSKISVEFSANTFQKKLIKGFKAITNDFSVLSAPGIASFPNGYRKISFKGFSIPQDEYSYVKFNNVWGIRNYSRAKNLKKALRPFIVADEDEKMIVIYSAHTPFLQAAIYAKKRDPRIKLCLVALDLPEYMNLSNKKSLMYRLGKKYDIRKFNALLPKIDSFMLLTEGMKQKLNVENKPHIIVEGIIEENQLHFETVCKEKSEKYIVYAGKLYEKFGVKNLVLSFKNITHENYRLILCGTGDCVEFIKEEETKDSRICFQGQVKPEVVKQWVENAHVLVNPRPNNEEYTKYSFPSKNIEYLASGKPLVAYMLDGMPLIYQKFICEPKNDTIDALSQAIIEACEMDEEDQAKRFEQIKAYLLKLRAENTAKKIINMTLENERI